MTDHRCGPRDCLYSERYIACRVCRARWDWTDRGWQRTPRTPYQRHGGGR